MFATTRSVITISALLAVAGCDQRAAIGASPLAPSAGTVQAAVSGAGRFGVSGGSSRQETLSGPAINGVVPEGQAIADMSQFVKGGSTILSVHVKNVNLPDGTVLGVTLDFSPVGTLTLSRGEGTLSASIGHFAVSNDEVRINNGTTAILSGPFFK